MHKIKVTISHSALATLFQPDLLSNILDFLSTSSEYWSLVSYSHCNILDFVNQANTVEVFYQVKTKNLLTFKEAFKNLLKSCDLPLAEVKFKYIGE